MDARFWSHSAKRSARSPPSVIPSCNPAKREGERRKEKRTPIPAMLTIPGPTQTRYFHFHKHQEWNTNTHHPKDSMMSAPHHCRQRRSAWSHHPSLLSNRSVFHKERWEETERHRSGPHNAGTLITSTDEHRAPRVTLQLQCCQSLPAAGRGESTHPFIRHFSIQVGA